MKVRTTSGASIPVYTLYGGKGCIRMTIMKDNVYCCTHHREMKKQRILFRKKRNTYV